VACVLLTGGRSPENKVVALTFSGKSPGPQIAVKLARVERARGGLEREARVLRAVHAARPHAGIPQLVARTEFAGRVALVETAMTGLPLTDFLDPRTHHKLCLKVIHLLAGLAAEPRPRWSEAWLEHVAAPAIGALARSDQERARAALAGLGPLPEVFEQRDCSPWNVVISAGGEATLLDWESAEEHGVPGLDAFYFLTYASFFVERTMHTGRELGTYQRMLSPSTGIGRVYAGSMRAYADRVGVEESTLGSLRLLCWLVHAWSAGVREGTHSRTELGDPRPVAGRGAMRGRDAALFLLLAHHELGLV
jgi:predicted Ser/Thr protein kinase